MAKFKIIQEVDACIGCGACTVIASGKFEMNDDGKANIVNGQAKNGNYEKVFDEVDLEEYKEACEACPVESLHIENLETGEKII